MDIKTIVVMSHPLTSAQLEDVAIKNTEIVSLTPEQKNTWSNIPTDEDMFIHVRGFGYEILETVAMGDRAIVQGEPGATFYLVSLLQSRGVRCMHATTVRESVEVGQPDGSVRKTNTFKHVMFRNYLAEV